ncbi:MAG: hypothetical protein KDE46_23765 [Caldilineaceae bacterium]|nr:hypothetical protein [Caldilineaceae bacterium]
MNMRHVRQSTAIAEGIHEGGFKLCNLGAVSFILNYPLCLLEFLPQIFG